MKTDLKKYAGLLTGLFLLYLCIRYWDGFVSILSLAVNAAAPLILGAVIAYILNILMSFFERHYLKKNQIKDTITLETYGLHSACLCQSDRNRCIGYMYYSSGTD